ncbi:MAG: NAD-dependent deacylase [Gammaproteobacteria bacterium]|nr:NAD-dependent deacylase [Gammaproteobacteria bacterium]
MNDLISQLEVFLSQSRQIVVMTGAGVSAESGIATFRDHKESLWAKYDPTELASPEGFAKDPHQVWAWYQWRRQQIAVAQPNPAHYGIAKLAERHNLTLVTQNVDGLHYRAGSKNVYELHGDIMKDKCNASNCDYQQPAKNFEAPLTRCPKCQDEYLRPSVVWFGESLNADLLFKVEQATEQCSLFLSVGTSSQVYPAAGFAELAYRNGATIIEINPNATGLTSQVTLAINKPAGEVFAQLNLTG